MTGADISPKDRVGESAQLFGLWSGFWFFTLFFIGTWTMMGFIPPPLPALSGAELFEKYDDNILMLKGGVIMCLIAAALYVPWSATLAAQVERMELGKPIFSPMVMGAGVLNAFGFTFPYLIWAGVYYRPDGNGAHEVALMLNDLAWLEFIMLYPPLGVQLVCIGLATLQNKTSIAVFPRWFGYMCFWAAFLFVPGGFAIFFFGGPMHWGGIIAFWVPVATFIVFCPVWFWLVRKAVKDHKNHVAEPLMAATQS